MPASLSQRSPNILDRKDIPTDPHSYVYRRADKGGRWHLYFYDQFAGTRHRFALKNANGIAPKPITEAQEEAWMLGLARYMELKAKADRGEAISSLTFGDMCKQFLAKEKKKISSIPHQGISAARYRLLMTQLRWVRDYVGDEKRQIHKFRRSAFLNYEIWRKERALEFKKDIPVQTTILQEMSTLKRAFEEIGVKHGYVSRDSIPEIPSIKLPKDKKHRRDDLTDKEWEQLERACRHWWTKGLERVLDEDGEPTKKGSSYVTRLKVDGVGVRSANQLIHRQLLYFAMRIMMDTGIRPGSLWKIQWKHISENTTIPKEERKTWVIVEVPPENTKTGRYYRISAPIASHLEKMKQITKYNKREDYLFANQKDGRTFSDRIKRDSFCEAMVEARLADWSEDDSNSCRKIDISSGKNLTWYSFRHTHITMRLKAGTPLPVLAANTDTSMQYIEDHYFHYRADEATENLGKGRKKLTAASDHLSYTG